MVFLGEHIGHIWEHYGPSPCAPTDLEKRVEANEWIGYMFLRRKIH